MNGGPAARAALCVLLLGAVCAGGAGPPAGRPRGPGDGVPVAAGLRTATRLEAGRTPRSDVVGLWQSVLWADGYSARSAVNCTYDAAAVGATRVWQSNHHLSADGIVGPATWGAAQERIAPAGPWLVYQGERYDLPLRVGRDGAYEVYDAGRFDRLRTDRVTLSRCR